MWGSVSTAEERVTAVVKFSPLLNGARALSVTALLNERAKVCVWMGTQENTQIVSITRHSEMVDEKVFVERHHRHNAPVLHHSMQTSHQSTQWSSAPAAGTSGAIFFQFLITIAGAHAPKARVNQIYIHDLFGHGILKYGALTSHVHFE
ncbi:hypothetical protein A0H81_04633 [Grifola frondosa]|uniref:Uncharacterized protein n=1 Tax=Grifola frondosa TaxID=5627 RepID=A0A1C7MH63_GRIFR|nr:hypothetical protein A0H81_04633 [Grifola frondosa]